MDGNVRIEEAASYLSRLTGQSVTADAALALRSVHRAAFGAWARQARISLREDLIGSRGTYSLRDLITDDEDMAAAPSQAGVAPSVRGAAMFSGIGLDIEEVAALPSAEDYREHPFYRAHFTPSEIGYAIRQPDTQATLCGIWAAKEALLKAGIINMPAGGMKTVEILRDANGRPGFANCHLSISHTPHTAVAVCLPARPAEKPLAVPAATPMQFTAADDAAEARARSAKLRRLGLIAGAMVLVAAALSVLILHGRA